MAERFEKRKLMEAKGVLDAIKDFSTPLEGTPNAQDLQKKIEALEAQVAKVASLRAQLTEALNVRNHIAYEMNDLVKRLRALVKAQFGDDSSEYEMVGRKRLSERRHPSRRSSGEDNPESN